MRNSPKPISSIANNLNFQSQQAAPKEFELPPQAIAIVNDLFKDLKGICTAWQHTFTDEAIEQAAKQQWAQALLENGIVNQQQIDLGMKKARKLAKPWFPSSGEFISWCKPSLEDYGLPSPEIALRRIMGGQKRSHPVLFLAAQATGMTQIRNMHHKDLMALFSRNYEILCQRFINGEDLSIEIPKALPEKVNIKTSEEQVMINAANLRYLLNTKKGAA